MWITSTSSSWLLLLLLLLLDDFSRAQQQHPPNAPGDRSKASRDDTDNTDYAGNKGDEEGNEGGSGDLATQVGELVQSVRQGDSGEDIVKELADVVEAGFRVVRRSRAVTRSGSGREYGNRWMVTVKQGCLGGNGTTTTTGRGLDEHDGVVMEEYMDEISKLGGTVVGDVLKSLRGFVVDFGEVPLPLQGLNAMECIEEMEQDMAWRESQVQEQAPWGLDRIDQVKGELDHRFTFDLTGEGVNVYVIDSGVLTSHSEFKGRAEVVYEVPELEEQELGVADCGGHGSHVAGLVAGTNTGVAKNANIMALRVIGCGEDARMTHIADALQWLERNHERPAVLSMSLGPPPDESGTLPRSPLMEKAIDNLIASGVTVVVAAGNDAIDACSGTPAGHPDVITVGSTNANDERAPFSNYGSCLDIFAPGDDIVSISSTDPDGYAIKSGTSQSCPMVAGVIALLMEQDPTITPAQAKLSVESLAQEGVVSDAKGSANRILQMPFMSASVSEAQEVQLVPLAPPGTLPADGQTSTTDVVMNTLLGLPVWAHYTILVGLALVAIAFLSCLFCCCFRCRRSRRRSSKVSVATSADGTTIPTPIDLKEPVPTKPPHRKPEPHRWSTASHRAPPNPLQPSQPAALMSSSHDLPSALNPGPSYSSPGEHLRHREDVPALTAAPMKRKSYGAVPLNPPGAHFPPGPGPGPGHFSPAPAPAPVPVPVAPAPPTHLTDPSLSETDYPIRTTDRPQQFLPQHQSPPGPTITNHYPLLPPPPQAPQALPATPYATHLSPAPHPPPTPPPPPSPPPSLPSAPYYPLNAPVQIPPGHDVPGPTQMGYPPKNPYLLP